MLALRLRRISVARLAIASAAIGAAADVGLWTYLTLRFGIHNDFSGYLTYAYLGLHYGWPHLYDSELTRPLLSVVGSHFQTNQYPPPTMWLVVPLLYVPYQVAYWFWWVLMLASMLAVWLILAPPDRGPAHLLFMTSLLPLGLSLWLGQIVPLIAACVAVSWWLLRRGRDVEAGLVLGLITLKPNLAILVPVALLASGRWRAAAIGVAVLGALAALSAWALTPSGVERYIEHVQQVSLGPHPFLFDPGTTLAGTIGNRPALAAADIVVVAATCWVARRGAPGGLELGLAASIVASLLLSPYLHPQDLLMLLPAYWLTLRALPGARVAAWLAAPIWVVSAASVLIPELLLVWLAGLVRVRSRRV